MKGPQYIEEQQEDGTHVHHLRENNNWVTIVAVEDDNHYRLGVTRCGDNERYIRKLGIDIATHRAEIQPYTIISKGDANFLGAISRSISKHIEFERQPTLSNLRRIKTKKK